MRTIPFTQITFLFSKPAIALFAITVAWLTSPHNAEAAHPGQLSSQCQGMDVESPQSIFECVGTIRHRNGQLKINRIDREVCA